jgi:hypothetical protein
LIKHWFSLALLGELSSWREHMRNRSAELLLILTVYCKKALTEDFHHTVKLAKAIGIEMSLQSKNNLQSKLGPI